MRMEGGRFFDKKVIDDPRWELLKLWYGPEAANKWDREWERTTSWESEGGRTLDWTLTLELRRGLLSRGLKLMVRAHTLTADPSYEQYLEEHEATGFSKEIGSWFLCRKSVGNTDRAGWTPALRRRITG